MSGTPEEYPSTNRFRMSSRYSLDDKFADLVNAVAGSLEDKVGLQDIQILSPKKRILAKCNPPLVWEEFIKNLDIRQKAPLISALGRIVRYGTLGAWRSMPLDEVLRGSEKGPKVPPLTAVFLKRALHAKIES